VGFAKGFKLFPREGYGSVTLNCFFQHLNVDLLVLVKVLKSSTAFDRRVTQAQGQGVPHFHMGDETDETMGLLLRALTAPWPKRVAHARKP